MDNKLIVPLGIGAVALLALFAFSGDKKDETNGGNGSNGGISVDGVDQAFTEGLVAHLNQCWEDGEISSPTSDTDSFVGKGVMDAAALAQSYVTTVFCASRFVDSFGLPEGDELQALREDAGTIARAWLRNLMRETGPVSLERQAEESKIEAESEGFVSGAFKDTLLSLIPFGLGEALKARGLLKEHGMI